MTSASFPWRVASPLTSAATSLAIVTSCALIAACGGGSATDAGERELSASVHMASSSDDTGDTGASTKPFAALTPAAIKPPDDPVLLGGRSAGRSGRPAGSLLASNKPVAYAGECLVDFTDPDALEATGPSLYFDRLYVPWFQKCGDVSYVDVRPTVLSHLHLLFQSSEVEPCNTHPQAYPSRINDDGTCALVDIRTEPRTAILTHHSYEFVRVMAQAYNSPKLPDYQPLAFDLNRIRVNWTPVRLCYRKNQEINDDWATAPGLPPNHPGVWLCWNRLEPGYWDLSDWATDLTEVRVTGAAGEVGNFLLDDLQIGIR